MTLEFSRKNEGSDSSVCRRSGYDLESERNKRGDRRGGDREMTEEARWREGGRAVCRKRAEDERRLAANERELERGRLRQGKR